MFPILWGFLQSSVFTVFSNAGGVLLSLQNKTLDPTPRSKNKNSDHAGPNPFVQNEMKFIFWRILGEPRWVNKKRQDDAKEKMLEPKIKTIL